MAGCKTSTIGAGSMNGLRISGVMVGEKMVVMDGLMMTSFWSVAGPLLPNECTSWILSRPEMAKASTKIVLSEMANKANLMGICGLLELCAPNNHSRGGSRRYNIHNRTRGVG